MRMPKIDEIRLRSAASSQKLVMGKILNIYYSQSTPVNRYATKALLDNSLIVLKNPDTQRHRSN